MTIKKSTAKKKKAQEVGGKEKPAVKKKVVRAKKIISRDIEVSPSLPEIDLENDFFETPKKKFQLPKLTSLAIFAVLLILIVLSVDLIGIYKFNCQDIFSYQVAKILRLPAGSIDGRKILLSDYFDDSRVLKQALKNQREGLNQQASATDDNETIFNRLVGINVMKNELKNNNITVNADEVSQTFDNIIAQFPSQDEARQAIEKNYSLSLEQFKAKILLPLIYRDKLQKLVAYDQTLPINKAAKEKANQVILLAKNNNSDFASLAKEYNEDESTINTGGDLGWIKQSYLPENYLLAMSSTSKTYIFDQVVNNDLGYDVVKVEDRLSDKETGENSFKMRHILIKVDVDAYIKSLIDEAVVKNYLK